MVGRVSGNTAFFFRSYTWLTLILLCDFFPENDKVCFTAYLSSNPGSYYSKTVVYDRVMTNKGSAYNTADGVFTAQRAGLYIFIWNSMTNPNKICYQYLYKNGNSINLAAYSNGYSADNDGGTMSVVLELTAGDRIWVRSGHCDFLYGGEFISFTGCQLWRWCLYVHDIHDWLKYVYWVYPKLYMYNNTEMNISCIRLVK